MSGRLLYINPVVVFLATWGVVFYLYSLQLSLVLLPLTGEFLAMVSLLAAASVGAFLFGYLGARATRRQHRLPHRDSRLERDLAMAVKRMFAVAACVFVVTVLAFGGVPLLWTFTGSDLTYTDFGFPTLHGFFNSLVLITGTVVFWMLLRGVRFRGDRLIFLFCVAVPIVTLHRQSLVSLLLQCLFIFAALRRGSFLQAARGVFLILLGCGVLFSILGNIRTGNETLADLANLSNEGDSLPLSVLWLYMYLTTPLSNFFEVTNLTFAQSYGGTSLAGLTPTLIRSLVWGDPATVMTDFADRTFNAYTYAFVLFVDFRWWGVFVFTLVVLGCGGVLFRRFKSRPSLYNLLNLCLLNHVVFLFVFANFLLTWGVVFQFVVVRLMRRKLSSISALHPPKAPSRANAGNAPPHVQATPGIAGSAGTIPRQT